MGMPKQPKQRWEENMSLLRTEPNAQLLPSICGAQRLLVPFFVITAMFLFFPCDLPIVSLVADDPGETRDVSLTTLHPYTVTAVQFAVEGFTDFACVNRLHVPLV